MAITHSAFLTQVRNYTEVDSNVLSDTLLDQFIRNVELDIAGQVDYDDLRKYATSNTLSGNRYVSMPSDLLILRSVQIINSNIRDFLEKKDTSFISEFAPNETVTGTPKYFANWDETNILLAPTPNANFEIQINYIKDPPHFDSSTNTFLSEHQEALLLYGVLRECFGFLKGPEDLYKLYSDRYNQSIQAFGLQQMGRRRRGEYDSGVPRVKIPSPSP
jgi:hypothetical protein|tara:strand:- start:354 stop:1007 length:654 start_codon:yes stop_codon:yes gene_type:complete